MTTEDDFQRALDARPDDWQTRLVFADWLQDRADPRAEGYRALGLGRKRTDTTTSGKAPTKFHWWSRDYTLAHYSEHQGIFDPVSLATDWFLLIKPGRKDNTRRNFTTRRQAEDAAARAFVRLSPERRAEILAMAPFVPPPKPAPKKPRRKSKPPAAPKAKKKAGTPAQKKPRRKPRK